MPPRARPARWRGPRVKGEFPTLGWQVIDWIESMLVIPDGPQRGRPLALTDEQCRHLLHAYRLDPKAKVHPRFPRPVDGLRYYGTQLRRPQKWGKDPIGAARTCAHALGPVQFDGWDAAGEPVGRPVDTPWCQVVAVSDGQTDNTFRPIFRMLSEGPLADMPGLDIGETRIKLPGGDGWIEPVTSSASSRLGNPITWASITEPHLMVERGGGVELVRAIKRNLQGMGGSWAELTNAWDPSQGSAAQLTGEAVAPGVYLDHVAPDLPPLTTAEYAEDDVVLERIVLKYGDSCRARGGWVDERSMLALIRDSATGEAQGRRFILDEVTVGDRDAVDPLRWNALARPGELLAPGTAVALGFDGSRVGDSTALKACRISDGRWFTLGIWNPAEHGGKVPESAVEQAVDDAMSAYTVWHLIADPFRWQTVLDRLAGRWQTNPADKPVVVEFPTNVEARMDAAVDLWETAYRAGEGEFTHDGHKVATEHAFNAAIALGKRKQPREGEQGTAEDRYKRVVKKRRGHVMDDFVAGILATFGRGLAIEHGALEAIEPEPWVMFT